MFRNPINVFPYGNAVDMTDTGDQIKFSFIFQGDVLRQWCIEIRETTTNNIFYTSPIQNNINNPKYNGDACELEITVGAGGVPATTIQNLNWSIYMNDSTTPLTPTTIITDSHTYQSNCFYFINTDTPTIDNIVIDNASPVSGEDYSYTVNSRILNFTADYVSNDTQTPLKYYQALLIDDNNETLVDTGYRYTSDIQVEFDGLVGATTDANTNTSTPTNYTLILILANQYDLIKQYTFNLSCVYEPTIVSTFLQSLEYDSQEAANVITWLYTKNSLGTATGDYTINNNSEVEINSGMIYYDSLNGQNLNIDYNNFAFTFKITVNPSVIYDMLISSASQKLCTIDFDSAHYFNFIAQDGDVKLVYKNGENQGTNILFTYPFTDVFAIQDQNLQDQVTNNRYMWYEDDTHIWTSVADNYWITNSQQGLAPATLVIILEVQEGEVTKSEATIIS